MHTLYIVQKYSNDCHQQNFTSATNYQNGPADKISGTLFRKRDKIASNIIPLGDNYNWEDFKNYLCVTNMNMQNMSRVKLVFCNIQSVSQLKSESSTYLWELASQCRLERLGWRRRRRTSCSGAAASPSCPLNPCCSWRPSSVCRLTEEILVTTGWVEILRWTCFNKTRVEFRCRSCKLYNYLLFC